MNLVDRKLPIGNRYNTDAQCETLLGSPQHPGRPFGRLVVSLGIAYCGESDAVCA